MEGLDFGLEGPALHWTAVLFAGALTGSFLNVLVHRLPRMHRRRRLRDAGAEEDAERIWPGPYNLFLPRSHCPHCRAPIPWQRNIPLLSWLLLRGVAPCCGEHISARYFFLELLTVLAFCATWLRFGRDPLQAMAIMGALSLLLAIAFLHRKDAPELAGELSQPLLWGGLLLGALGWLAPLTEALWSSGACALAALCWSGASMEQRPWTQPWGRALIDVQSLWLVAALGAWGGASAVWTVLGAVVALRFLPVPGERLPLQRLTALAGIGWLAVRGVS